MTNPLYPVSLHPKQVRTMATTSNPEPLRTLTVVPIAALLGVAVLGFHALLFPEAPPKPGEYFWSQLATQQLSWFTLGFAGAAAAGLGYVTRANGAVIGASMVLVFPAIVFWEISTYPTSHNLVPFELVMYAALSAPLMFAAWLGRRLKRTRGEQ